MGVKSRRSSDSSVVSSPFKVLPPIPNLTEDSDKEGVNDSNKQDENGGNSVDDQDHDADEWVVASNGNVPKQTPKVVRYVDV